MDKINAVYAVENTIGGGMKNRKMTAAEVREKHGEIVTYDLGKPQPYEIFSTWPDDVQREYLKKLYWTHGAGYKDIGNMLGITFNRVADLFNDFSLPRRPPHTRNTPEQKAAWKAFLMGKTLVKDTLPEETAQKLAEMVKEETPVLTPAPDEQKEKLLDAFIMCATKESHVAGRLADIDNRLDELQKVKTDNESDAGQALLYAIKTLVHHSGAHVEIKISI